MMYRITIATDGRTVESATDKPSGVLALVGANLDAQIIVITNVSDAGRALSVGGRGPRRTTVIEPAPRRRTVLTEGTES